MIELVRKQYTLTIIKKQEKLLLGLKKRGFGLNKICGFGGKIEKGETISGAAIREVQEECNVDVSASLRKAGKLEYTFEGEHFLMEMHVFHADNFTGQPQESDEMRPEWYPIDDLPLDRMWADDKLWFPILLRGACFKGAFHYTGHDTILSQTLEEVPLEQIDE